MAYDKVVDSSVLDAGLKQIADAIREKGGTSDPIAFDAMAAAIAAIEAGEGVKIAAGSFTLNDESTYKYYVDHNMGIVPKIIYVGYYSYGSGTSDNRINSLLYVNEEYATDMFGLSPLRAYCYGRSDTAKYSGKIGANFNFIKPYADTFEIELSTSFGSNVYLYGNTYMWFAIGVED